MLVFFLSRFLLRNTQRNKNKHWSWSDLIIIYKCTTSPLHPIIITLCHHPAQTPYNRHVPASRKIIRFSNTESFPKRLWYFFKNMHIVKYVVYIVYHKGTFKIISPGLILKGQSSFGEVDSVMIISLRSFARLLQWSRIKGEACCVCECPHLSYDSPKKVLWCLCRSDHLENLGETWKRGLETARFNFHFTIP